MGPFHVGAVTSNGGGALLAGADRKLRLAQRLRPSCESPSSGAVPHALTDLPRLRVSGLPLDCDDLIDHGGHRVHQTTRMPPTARQLGQAKYQLSKANRTKQPNNQLSFGIEFLFKTI